MSNHARREFETKETKQQAVPPRRINLPTHPVIDRLDKLPFNEWHKEINQNTLEQTDDQGNTPLLWAIQAGRTDLASYFGSIGANIRAKNPWGKGITGVLGDTSDSCIEYATACLYLDESLEKVIAQLADGAKAIVESLKAKQDAKYAESSAPATVEGEGESLQRSILQEIINQLKKLNLEEVPLLYKIELHATVNSLLSILRQEVSEETLVEKLRALLHEREILLSDTPWDYCFAPTSAANQISYFVAEKLLPLLPNFHPEKEDYKFGKMDLLLHKTKTERRPAHAPQWLSASVQEPVLPDDPRQIVRFNGEIHDWQDILSYACAQLKRNEMAAERVFLKTDNKSTKLRTEGEAKGTPSKPGPLPLVVRQLLSHKGRHCLALVRYVERLAYATDIRTPFEKLHTALVAGSIKGDEKSRGSEMDAGAIANVELTKFFVWWDALDPTIKERIGKLEAEFHSGYSNEVLNGKKSIKELLDNLRKPVDGDVRTCIEVISRTLLAILDKNEATIIAIQAQSTEQYMSRNSLESIEVIQEKAYQDAIATQTFPVYIAPIKLHNNFDVQYDSLQDLLIIKLANAVVGQVDYTVEEILYSYPHLAGAIVQTSDPVEAGKPKENIYQLIKHKGSQAAKACVERVWIKSSINVLQQKIADGDRDAVEKMLQDNSLLNAILPNGFTPLAFAIEKSLAIAEFLLHEKQADVSLAKDDASKSAVDLLLETITKPETKPGDSTLQKLIKAAACQAAANNKRTSLQKIVDKMPGLLEEDKPECKPEEAPLLFVAARHGSKECVEYLLSKGVDPFKTIKLGNLMVTARQWAEQQIGNRRGPVQEAAIKMLLDKEAEILKRFAQDLDESAVTKALAASPDWQNRPLADNLKPREFQDCQLLCDAIKKSAIPDVSKIIKCHPTWQNKKILNGLTPLAFAVSKQAWDVVNFLLDQCVIDFIGQGNVPGPNTAAAELLVKTMQEYSQGSQIAAMPSVLLEIAKKMIFAAAKQGCLPVLQQIAEQEPSLLAACNSNNEFLLCVAACSASKECVEYLLSKNANPFERSGQSNKSARQHIEKIEEEEKSSQRNHSYSAVREILLSKEGKVLQQITSDRDRLRLERILTAYPDWEKRVRPELGYLMPGNRYVLKTLIFAVDEFNVNAAKEVADLIEQDQSCLNIAGCDDLTPLAYAIRGEAWEVADFLLSVGYVDFNDQEGRLNNNIEVADLLVKAMQEYGSQTEIPAILQKVAIKIAFAAVRQGCLPILYELVEQMPWLKKLSHHEDGYTLLSVALKRPKESRDKCVKYLLSVGAELSVADAQEGDYLKRILKEIEIAKPLEQAIGKGEFKAVKEMLDRDSAWLWQTPLWGRELNNGYSPVAFAVKKGAFHIAVSLILAGGDKAMFSPIYAGSEHAVLDILPDQVKDMGTGLEDSKPATDPGIAALQAILANWLRRQIDRASGNIVVHAHYRQVPKMLTAVPALLFYRQGGQGKTLLEIARDQDSWLYVKIFKPHLAKQAKKLIERRADFEGKPVEREKAFAMLKAILAAEPSLLKLSSQDNTKLIDMARAENDAEVVSYLEGLCKPAAGARRDSAPNLSNVTTTQRANVAAPRSVSSTLLSGSSTSSMSRSDVAAPLNSAPQTTRTDTVASNLNSHGITGTEAVEVIAPLGGQDSALRERSSSMPNLGSMAEQTTNIVSSSSSISLSENVSVADASSGEGFELFAGLTVRESKASSPDSEDTLHEPFPNSGASSLSGSMRTSARAAIEGGMFSTTEAGAVSSSSSVPLTMRVSSPPSENNASSSSSSTSQVTGSGPS